MPRLTRRFFVRPLRSRFQPGNGARRTKQPCRRSRPCRRQAVAVSLYCREHCEPSRWSRERSWRRICSAQVSCTICLVVAVFAAGCTGVVQESATVHPTKPATKSSLFQLLVEHVPRPRGSLTVRATSSCCRSRPRWTSAIAASTAQSLPTPATRHNLANIQNNDDFREFAPPRRLIAVV